MNTFENFSYLTIYQISFFILFTTIALNVIFGIIVDTFSELRDLKWLAEKDMRSNCFICSRDSYDFESHAQVAAAGLMLILFTETRTLWWGMDSERSRRDKQHLVLQGMLAHVKNDHNMWAYMYYFIYLNEVKENDYTCIDLYVSKMVRCTTPGFNIGVQVESEFIRADNNHNSSQESSIYN